MMKKCGNVRSFTFVHHSCKYVTVKQVCMYIRKEEYLYVCVFIPHMKYTHLYVCSTALNFGHDWINACCLFEQVDVPFAGRQPLRCAQSQVCLCTPRLRLSPACLSVPEAACALALAYIATLHHRRCCDQRTYRLLSRMHNRQPWFVLTYLPPQAAERGGTRSWAWVRPFCWCMHSCAPACGDVRII